MKIITTSDGSSSIFLEDLNEHYHSVHGAHTESMHVFIEAGLRALPQNPLYILEMGFGTGLNCLLTMIHRDNRTVFYTGVERFPLSAEIISQLEFPELNDEKIKRIFRKMHDSEWDHPVEIKENFFLEKIQISLLHLSNESKFDLIYFDAFGRRNNPNYGQRMYSEKCFPHLNRAGSSLPIALKVM